MNQGRESRIIRPDEALIVPESTKNKIVRPMAHLHQHTQYSMLDGAAREDSLVKWVASQSEGEAKAVAMTDHGNMHAAVNFWKAAHKHGVKPIIGFEAYVVAGPLEDTKQERYHLTLLAMNLEGYRNLCRLNAKAWRYGFHMKPRITHQWLAEHAEGVICLSGCIGAEVPQLLIQGRYQEAKKSAEWHARTFPGRYFIELQRHTMACGEHAEKDSEAELGNLQLIALEGLQQIAKELGLGRVATNDGHYVERRDADMHDKLLALQTRAKLSDEKRFRFACDAFYVKSAAEMQEMLPPEEYGQEIYDNTIEIVRMCEDNYLPVGTKQYQLPMTQTPQGTSELEAICAETFQGLMARYPQLGGESGHEEWLERSRRAYQELDTLRKRKLQAAKKVPGQGATTEQLQILLAACVQSAVEDCLQAGDRIPSTPGVDPSAPPPSPGQPAEGREASHPQALIDRALYELGVIGKMGFPGYFRIVAEYVNWAKKNGVLVGPGRGCLAPETPICMGDGTIKPICDVRTGERVITRDGNSHRVLDTYSYPCEEELIHIWVEGGDPAGVAMTGDHLVLGRPSGQAGELEWLPARSVTLETQLFTPQGREGGQLKKVLEISTQKAGGTVHDLKVEHNHNYLTSSFIVHNSGAGSIVAYALGITDIDPIEHQLLFERFLNPDRVSMPDFDVDFDDRRRHEVAQHIRDLYGEERVAQISIFQSFQSRVAFKDIAGLLEVDFKTRDEITKLIPVHQGKAMKLSEALEQIPGIRPRLNADPRLSEAWETALKIEGMVKAKGVHAAGLVIGATPLTDTVPLTYDAATGMPVAQYDMKGVEEVGLVKMDLLGLRTLSLIAEVTRLIDQVRESTWHRDPKAAHEADSPHNQVPGKSFDILKIPTDDQATFELIGQGDTSGVFQLEGSGITAYARQMKPRSLQDIIALGALYRPGPMANIPTYIRRMHGEEELTYPEYPAIESKLRPVLDVTYGIPVYQEQIMQLASDVAGYTLGEADLLRRIMGKKKPEEMAEQRIIFVKKSMEQGAPESEASHLFDLLEKFAEYGFNRSHSAAYGLISYQTAYLKAHWPLEFWAALMTTEQGDVRKLASYVSEARARGMEVLPPSTYDSGTTFTPMRGDNGEPSILFGLSAIKGVSEDAAAKLIRSREEGGDMASLRGIIEGLAPDFLKSNILEALIDAGAMDHIASRATLRLNLQRQIDAYRTGSKKREKLAKQLEISYSLFDLQVEDTYEELEIATEPTTEAEKARARAEEMQREFKALQIYLSGHPVTTQPALFRMADIHCQDLEIDEEASGNRHQKRGRQLLAVQIEQVKPINSRIGTMAKLLVSDETGTANVVIFPDNWKQLEGSINIRQSDGELQLVVIAGNPGRESGEFVASGVGTLAEIEQLSHSRRVTLSPGPEMESMNLEDMILLAGSCISDSDGWYTVLEMETGSGTRATEIALQNRAGPRDIERLESQGFVIEIEGRRAILELLAKQERRGKRR